jgi:hypothetical protein
LLGDGVRGGECDLLTMKYVIPLAADDAVWFVADQVKVPASELKVPAPAASRAGKRRDLTRLP